MTPLHKAALADVPIAAAAVVFEVDAAKVAAYVAAGFFALLAFFVQREWTRHEERHARVDARLDTLESRHARELETVR